MATCTATTYKVDIENAIAKQFENTPTEIHKACRYALLNGGKRLRPAIALMVAEALGNGHAVTEAALAVEYFHTASLVIDDLPCMDDDDLRREKPSTHKVFGEAVTLLVSYALIAEGYGLLAKNCQALNITDSICSLAIENASYNTGLTGVTGGQFMDIYPPDLELETVKEVIHKKTSSLFEIAFVVGWLYGGGATAQLKKVKEAAKHYGLAFQIADDIDDMAQDKQNGRQINTGNILGIEGALALFESEAAAYRQCLKELNIATPSLTELLPEGSR